MVRRTFTLRTRLERFRERHGTPALGAGVVHRDGHLVMELVGERVHGAGDPVQLHDRWHLGSCGKSITAALYARLVERGDAEWGVPLSALFPDLRDSAHPGWDRVTIHDALVSQAGLPANLTKAELVAAWTDARPPRDQRTAVAARALARPPHKPGRFLYSNLGYIVIGAAIERITDQPYESALATEVMAPLGITSGGFGPPASGIWGHGGRALSLGPLGVIGLGSDGPADPAEAQSDNPTVMNPAGRLHLTLEDWAKFQNVFIAHGGDFLRPETIELLLTPAPGRGRRMSPGWARMAGRADASFGQQGSNLFWNATAVIDKARRRTAMLVCNDGRVRVLRKLPSLATEILSD